MVNGRTRRETGEITSSRLSFNLDSMERNVKGCNPTAIEDAASIGSDINSLSGTDYARFRSLITTYKDDCRCLSIPRPTRERAEEAIRKFKTGAGQLVRGAEEKVSPTIEEIRAGIAPTLEEIRAGIAPTLEKISESITPTLEDIRSRIEAARQPTSTPSYSERYPTYSERYEKRYGRRYPTSTSAYGERNPIYSERYERY